MSIYKKYLTNKVKETEGVWVEFPEDTNDDGTIPALLIKRAGGANTEYSKAFERARRPYMSKILDNTADNGISLIILVSAFVDSVLVSWRDVRDIDDQNITYTPEAAKRTFLDLPDFFEKAQAKASELKNFQDQALETSAKN